MSAQKHLFGTLRGEQVHLEQVEALCLVEKDIQERLTNKNGAERIFLHRFERLLFAFCFSFLFLFTLHAKFCAITVVCTQQTREQLLLLLLLLSSQLFITESSLPSAGF